MTLRELIENEIRKNRDKLSASSLKTYVSTLFNLHKKIGFNDDTLKFFNNSTEILKYLEHKPSSTRKTILSALFVLTCDDAYNVFCLIWDKHVLYLSHFKLILSHFHFYLSRSLFLNLSQFNLRQNCFIFEPVLL